jgi:hypothetical protein
MALQVLQFLASLCAAVFAGAAVYINVAEHPARMLGDTHAAVAQWAPSYRRATLMQAPLALISAASGVSAWFSGASLWWLAAGLLMGAVVLFTFIAIMPTNRKLLAPGRAPASGETRALLERWGRLHAVRSVLSLVAAVLLLWLLSEARHQA